MLKCDQPRARGGANLPLKGPQTRSALGGEPIKYDDHDYDDDDDDDDYDDFDHDDNDDDDDDDTSGP